MEVKAKNTPGPWRVNPDMECETEVVPSNDSDLNFVAETCHSVVYGKGNRKPTREEKANARLIAAAPELYEACKKACEWFEKNSEWDKGDNGYYAMKQAISKIEQ